MLFLVLHIFMLKYLGYRCTAEHMATSLKILLDKFSNGIKERLGNGSSINSPFQVALGKFHKMCVRDENMTSDYL